MNTVACPECGKEFPIGQLHIVENGEDMFTCPHCGAEINVIFWFEEVNDYGDDSE